MTSHKRPPAWRRWLSVALRSLHLAGVVLVGLAIFGNAMVSGAVAALMVLTGFALYAIELWYRPSFWRELAGVFILVKLILLLAMLLFPGWAGAIFWLLLLASSVVSHAPRTFRHKRFSHLVRARSASNPG